MELMQRTKVGLIRRTPATECDILSHDPTRPRRLYSILSALVAASFLLVVLFSLAVVLIQPFLMIWHISPYPNLAAIAFTMFLVAGACLLISIPRTNRLYKFKKFLNKVFYVLLILIGVLLTAWLFILMSRETLGWVNFVDKLVYIYQQFFEWFFKILDWLGSTTTLPF